jgi:hypothetical protein
MSAFIKLGKEWMFVQVVRGANMTSLETQDGIMIEASIKDISLKNGILTYTRLGGYSGGERAQVSWEARPAI